MGQKYTDPETGAHFHFKDMCRRLQALLEQAVPMEPIPLDVVQEEKPPKTSKLVAAQVLAVQQQQQMTRSRSNDKQSFLTKPKPLFLATTAKPALPSGSRGKTPDGPVRPVKAQASLSKT